MFVRLKICLHRCKGALTARATLKSLQKPTIAPPLNFFKYIRAICCIYIPYSMLYNMIRADTSNEQNLQSYYMLYHRIRGLFLHYIKRKVRLQLASIFW